LTAATHTRQASRTPLGLALLLERGGATLVAPARTLAAGVVLEAFAAAVEGARPGSTAGCRGRRCVVREVGLKATLAALEAWVLGRVRGGLPGWSVEQVLVDMSEGTGAVWTLRGRDEAGATAWLRVELGRLGASSRDPGHATPALARHGRLPEHARLRVQADAITTIVRPALRVLCDRARPTSASQVSLT